MSRWKTLVKLGETSIKEFLALVDESIKESNRYISIFKRTKINNKTKLTIYKTYGGKVKFKSCYLLMGWVM